MSRKRSVKKKRTRKQQIIRLVVYISVYLLVFFILEWMKIRLTFWQQLFFVALPLLVIVDLIIDRVLKSRSSSSKS